MISYTITASTEHEELQRLLRYLDRHWTDGDELIIQMDSDTFTEEVVTVAQDWKILWKMLHDEERIQVVTCHLNKNFAAFKNNLHQYCHNEWIFNIDADELPSVFLLENIHSILESNHNVDAIMVPRWNTVEGLTQEHVDRWGWNIDSIGRINYPDYQWRIYKNNDNIKWINSVHEQLIGFNTYATLPDDSNDYCLFHNKTIERQEKQNQFYSTITK